MVRIFRAQFTFFINTIKIIIKLKIELKNARSCTVNVELK